MIATCPVHGERPFVRSEKNQWSYCSDDIAECQSVIPDELTTPDGADVVQWFEYRRICREVCP